MAEVPFRSSKLEAAAAVFRRWLVPFVLFDFFQHERSSGNGQFLMTTALDITYLLFEPGLTLDNAPVFQSQLVDRISVQTEQGVRAGVVCAVKDPDRFARIIQPALEASRIPFLTFPDAGIRSGTFRAAAAMRKFARTNSSRLVYVRGPWAALAHRMAFPVGGPGLIYDFRGDSLAEAAYFGGRKAVRHAVLKCLMRWSITRAERVYCVSRPAAEVIASRFGRKDARVIPSCVDTKRFAYDPVARVRIRATIGAGPADTVLIYSGGLSKYQQIDAMLKVWAVLAGEPSLKFLLLTNDTPAQVSCSFEVPEQIAHRVRRQSVPRSEIPGYLSAADVGFLLREQHPLNSVASPVKFAEYLSCGLAVVSTPGIGDVSDLILDRRLGAIGPVENASELVRACRELRAAVRADRAGYRDRAIEVARSMFDWRVYRDL